MPTEHPQATLWHTRPPQFKMGPCPICGFKQRNFIEHRRVAPEEGIAAHFLSRRKTLNGWAQVAIGGLKPARRMPGRSRPGPTEATIRLVTRAATMSANGLTDKQIAAELHRTADYIGELRTKKYPALWQQVVDQAMQKIVAAVRTAAGTDAVLADVAGHLAQARVAEKWLAHRGESLFPANGELTLSRLYHEFYVPQRLTTAAEHTRADYAGLIRLWTHLTGDPPLRSIDTALLAKFKAALVLRPGRHAWEKCSPNTVRSNLRLLQTLLDKAGPRGRRNRDALGLLVESPWIKPPEEELNFPRIVGDEELGAIYQAAVGMDVPRGLGFAPAAWWRALIVTAYNTGLRAGTLFKLRWEWLNLEKRFFSIPPHSMKARRQHVAPLNQTTIDHLQRIHLHGAELVFGSAFKGGWVFYRHWRQLQALAAIPPDKRFGLHAIRKTAATVLFGIAGLGVAQALLGHAASAVTMQHYVNALGPVAEAVDRIPQPKGFSAARP